MSGIPYRILVILCKACIHFFVERPDDDSSGIETCRPSPINNILMIVVFDLTILYILYT